MTQRLPAAALLLLTLSPAFAQKEAGREAASRPRWEAVAPEQREIILRNYRRYQAMTPEQRRALERRYRRYQKLSPLEKARLNARWRRFQALPEDEQQALRLRWERRNKSAAAKPGKTENKADRSRNRGRDSFLNHREPGRSGEHGGGGRRR